MATVTLVPDAIESAGTWTDFTASQLATSDNLWAQSPGDGQSFTAGVALFGAAPAMSSLNSAVLRIEASRSQGTGRSKAITVELLDASNNVITSFSTGDLTTTDTAFASSSVTGSYTKSDIDGWKVRVTGTEGGGMTVAGNRHRIDRIWLDLDYNLPATTGDADIAVPLLGVSADGDVVAVYQIDGEVHVPPWTFVAEGELGQSSDDFAGDADLTTPFLTLEADAEHLTHPEATASLGTPMFQVVTAGTSVSNPEAASALTLPFVTVDGDGTSVSNPEAAVAVETPFVAASTDGEFVSNPEATAALETPLITVAVDGEPVGPTFEITGTITVKMVSALAAGAVGDPPPALQLTDGFLILDGQSAHLTLVGGMLVVTAGPPGANAVTLQQGLYSMLPGV